jgi:hypothetical protein
MCESGVGHGCTYAAEHMDVREWRWTWMYLCRCAHGRARVALDMDVRISRSTWMCERDLAAIRTVTIAMVKSRLEAAPTRCGEMLLLRDRW